MMWLTYGLVAWWRGQGLHHTWHTPVAAVMAVMGFLTTASMAQEIGPGSITVKLEEIATNLGGDLHVTPTDLVPLNDASGRMAVATINGVVRLIDNSGNFLDSEVSPFLETRNEPYQYIPGNFAFGMTGIAFHPDYARPDHAGFGKFYTIITERNTAGGNPNPPDLEHGLINGAGAHQDVLVEWTADDPASNNPLWIRRDVLRFDQPHQNHNVTDLAFGPDGLLYISSGDGGTGDREAAAQDRETFLGSIMRIDPIPPNAPGIRTVNPNLALMTSSTTGSDQYQVPFGVGGNPGVGIPVEVDEIYAIGFRSAFRLNFDRQTGDLYVGDVGEGRLEEINVVILDGNYGWGRFEGSSWLHNPNIQLDNLDPHQLPIFEYTHRDGQTVIGGFVYRGSAIPELQGKYVFADLGRQVSSGQARTPARLFYGALDTGDIFEFNIDPSGEQLVEFVAGNLTSRQFILSIGEDEAGELYLVVGDDPQNNRALFPDGRILRILPSGFPG